MIKRKGHTSFESIIVIFIISIAIIIVATITDKYIEDARITRTITEVSEEDKAIKETIINIYSERVNSNNNDKLTGEYIVKKIKKNSNNSLKLYIYGEENPSYNEETADMIIYLKMQSDDGTMANPVTDDNISQGELLSIKAYHIVGRYGVYIYDGELHQ